MPKICTNLQARIILITFFSILPLLGLLTHLNLEANRYREKPAPELAPGAAQQSPSLQEGQVTHACLNTLTPLAGLPGGNYVLVNNPAPAISSSLPRTLPDKLPAGLGVTGLVLLLAWMWGHHFRKRRHASKGHLAEDKLAQLHQQQELILASATEGILGIDLQGNHTFVNPAAAALLGYEVEELLGRPSHSTWHHSKENGSPYPGEECHILETLKGDYRPNPVEEVFWRKDGTPFPVESNKNPVLENGRIVGIVVTFTDISARKQAEKALRESEKHYRTLMKTSPYSILDIDLHGRITAANDRASLLIGYQIEELINRRALDFIAQAECPEAMRTLEEIQKTGSVRNRVFNIIREDGTSFAAEVSASLITDDLGQPRSIIAIFRNISYRLEAEKALKAGEEKYRVLVNQIPAVVYKAYADCTIDFFDHKVEALTGYPKKCFDSRQILWKELILPEDLPEARKKFIHALKTSKAYVREYRIRRRNKEVRWIHNRGNIFCDAAGKIEYVSGVLFDITDRKQAEEKLFRASRALRALGEVNQALVHATEEQAFLQDVWRIIVEVTGYPLSWVGVPQQDPAKTIMPAAQMGRSGEDANWIRITWADDDPRGLGPGGEAIRTGKIQVIRNILANPTLAPWHDEARRRHYNSVIVLPLTLEQETIAILDILSEEVNGFDSEEIKLLEELASNVSQGISILKERSQRRQAMAEKAKLEMQLRQAQKMEAIGTLAGGIAHDFNNILTAIVGYSELILLNLDQKQDIQVIENHLNGVLQAGKRAKDLVQQILTFSRKKEQGKQPVQINLIILEAIKLLRASFPATIEIYSDIPSQCGLVLADPTQIHQVLMNMGTNAYHAMRENGGVLEISLGAEEVDAALANTHPNLRPGPYLRLSVRDSGHGMEPEVLERIFEPYFTTKGLSEGTGLGLAVVHGIISNLGGAILVDSQVGNGTAFQVYLPRLDGVGPGDIPEPVAAEPIAVSSRGEHILFIDDEPVLAHIGEKILKRLGYKVTVKTSSLEALELFSARPEDFDLIISDQTMPHLTGVQLAQKIIRLRPETPIILCTGSSETVAAKKAKEDGIWDYLVKPFNVGDLAKTIKRVLHPEESPPPRGNLN